MALASFPRDICLRASDNFNDAEIPVIVVLAGWMGCRDRALSKYARWYADEFGLDTIATLRFTAPPMPRARLDRIAAQLLDLLAQHPNRSARIVFHSFSNGGMIPYLALVRALHGTPRFASALRSRVRCSVFDSCPALYSSDWAAVAGGFNAAWTALDGNTPARALLAAACAAPALGFAWACARAWAAGRRRRLLLLGGAGAAGALLVRAARTRFQAMNERCPSRVPELYLYSRDDPLTNAGLVADLAATRKRLGVDVREKSWDRSGHVAHFLHHAEEYRREVSRFVRAHALGGRGLSPAASPADEGYLRVSGGGATVDVGGGGSGGSSSGSLDATWHLPGGDCGLDGDAVPPAEDAALRAALEAGQVQEFKKSDGASSPSWQVVAGETPGPLD